MTRQNKQETKENIIKAAANVVAKTKFDDLVSSNILELAKFILKDKKKIIILDHDGIKNIFSNNLFNLIYPFINLYLLIR